MGRYQRVMVSEVVTPVIGGTPSRSNANYWNGSIFWASAKDVANSTGRYLFATEDTITDSGLKNSAAKVLPKGTVVITARGTVGALVQLGKDMAFNQSCYGLVCSERINENFLLYALKSSLAEMRSLTYGTVFETITTKSFNHWAIYLPPLTEQLKIATILGSLDDKIELNRRMNRTLEDMARAIFKSWFVDFDPVRAKAEGRDPGLPPEIADLFPDSFQPSELGEIPSGWRVGRIGEIADVIDCLHSKKPERRESGKIFLQLNNIRDDGLLDLSEIFYISEEDYLKWTGRIEAREGDCVITNVGRVGAVAQIPSAIYAALGRNMTAIRCKDKYPFPTFLISCLLSDFMREEIRNKTDTGTILDALNVKNIPFLQFVLPPQTILRRYEELTRPFRMCMEENLKQNLTLASLRDTLLPRLISGDLRVKEAL